MTQGKKTVGNAGKRGRRTKKWTTKPKKNGSSKCWKGNGGASRGGSGELGNERRKQTARGKVTD